MWFNCKSKPKKSTKGRAEPSISLYAGLRVLLQCCRRAHDSCYSKICSANTTLLHWGIFFKNWNFTMHNPYFLNALNILRFSSSSPFWVKFNHFEDEANYLVTVLRSYNLVKQLPLIWCDEYECGHGKYFWVSLRFIYFFILECCNV